MAECPRADVNDPVQLVMNVKCNPSWGEYYLRFKTLPADLIRGFGEIDRYPVGNGYINILHSSSMPEHHRAYDDDPKVALLYIPGTSRSSDNTSVAFGSSADFVRTLKSLYLWQPTMHIIDEYQPDLTPIPCSEFKVMCDLCGEKHPFITSNFVEIHGSTRVICPTCMGTLTTCSLCGRVHSGDYCGYCFKKSVCAYCEQEGIYPVAKRSLGSSSSSSSLPLCPEHRKVLVIPINSYSYKPSPFTYHHIAV